MHPYEAQDLTSEQRMTIIRRYGIAAAGLAPCALLLSIYAFTAALTVHPHTTLEGYLLVIGGITALAISAISTMLAVSRALTYADMKRELLVEQFREEFHREMLGKIFSE